MTAVFALVDCNNFYASCETLFRPDLKGKPIVVLSNNDGCVVARSAEAKKLGIKAGVPVFQIQPLIKKHDIRWFSSNYTLYGDLSARVMQILEEMAPAVEIYSIDEAFLDLTGMNVADELTEYGRHIRQRVGQWSGITVCVGIAPTKTLSKLANHAAKHYPATQGVVNLMDPERQRKLLALTPVEEVWGIGRQLSAQMHATGIHTATQLAAANPQQIRRSYSVVVEKIVNELNGVSCLNLEALPPAKQQIMCSRSFGSRVTELATMRQAITEFAHRAGEKLREERQRARSLTVFIRTSHFNSDEPQYSNSMSLVMPHPVQDTRQLTGYVGRLLDTIWRDGFRYSKGGVMLADLSPEEVVQGDLFDQVRDDPRPDTLMKLMDEVNHTGRGSLCFARQIGPKKWAMARDHLSPAYTTRWNQLPLVR